MKNRILLALAIALFSLSPLQWTSGQPNVVSPPGGLQLPPGTLIPSPTITSPTITGTCVGCGKFGIYVADYGAKGDTRTVTDGVTTSGSTTVTSATANFTQADVGKYIFGQGSAVVQLRTTIKAVVNSTTVTTNANALQTQTGVTLDIGSDDTPGLIAAWNAAIALAPQATINFAPKKYLLRSYLPIPATLSFKSVGPDAYTTTGFVINGNGALIIFSPPGDFTWPIGSGGVNGIINAGLNNRIYMRDLSISARGVQYNSATFGTTFVCSHNVITVNTSDAFFENVVVNTVTSTGGSIICGIYVSGNMFWVNVVSQGNDIGVSLNNLNGGMWFGGYAGNQPNNGNGNSLILSNVGSGASGSDFNKRRPVIENVTIDESFVPTAATVLSNGSSRIDFVNCVIFEPFVSLTDYDDVGFYNSKIEPFGAGTIGGIHAGGNTSGAVVRLYNSKATGSGANAALVLSGTGGASAIIRDSTLTMTGSNGTVATLAAGTSLDVLNSSFTPTGSGVAISNSGTVIDYGENAFTGGITGTGIVRLPAIQNCSSSASPAVCGSASAGSVVVAAGATSVVVNTTAVTANSQIMLQEDDSLGTKLGVTCNTGILTSAPEVTGRVAATSFTITVSAAPAVNPACYSYHILN